MPTIMDTETKNNSKIEYTKENKDKNKKNKLFLGIQFRKVGIITQEFISQLITDVLHRSNIGITSE